MKISKSICILMSILSFTIFSQYPIENIANARVVESEQRPAPPYAKWGQLAMKETKSRYPRAKIVDYLHIGRKENPTVTTEAFKLWLRDGNKEFGVIITFEFDTSTEKIRKISFKETKN